MDYFLSDRFMLVKLLKTARLLKLAKILRLLKAFKMLRLLKLPRLMKSLEQFISRAVLSLATFLFIAVLYCHISACLFYYFGSMDQKEGAGNGWEGTLETSIPGKSHVKSYLIVLYWSLSTMATVGYARGACSE